MPQQKRIRHIYPKKNQSDLGSIDTNTPTHTHKHTPTHTHIHIHTHIQTYTYIHTPTNTNTGACTTTSAQGGRLSHNRPLSPIRTPVVETAVLYFPCIDLTKMAICFVWFSLLSIGPKTFCQIIFFTTLRIFYTQYV